MSERLRECNIKREMGIERESKKGVGVGRDWRQSGSRDDGWGCIWAGVESKEKKSSKEESDKLGGRSSRENEQGIH